MSDYIDIGSSSEESDDDLEIGFLEPSPQSDVLGSGSEVIHVGQPANQHRILPSNFTNGNGRAHMRPAGSSVLSSYSSTRLPSSYSSARMPSSNPSPLDHSHNGPGSRVLPSSLMGINKGKHVGPTGIVNGRLSNGVGTSMADAVGRPNSVWPILPKPFITNHSKPATSYYEGTIIHW
jgi:hypothetical protein